MEAGPCPEEARVSTRMFRMLGNTKELEDYSGARIRGLLHFAAYGPYGTKKPYSEYLLECFAILSRLRVVAGGNGSILDYEAQRFRPIC
jgi:hypothetical protein